MNTLQVNRSTGELSGSLECGHPPSSISTRTRNGDQVVVCEGCEKVGARGRHINVLRNAPGWLRVANTAYQGPPLAAAIEALLPELESQRAEIEFPTALECNAAYERASPFPGLGYSDRGIVAVRELCLRSRTPRVELPEWFMTCVRARAGDIHPEPLPASGREWSELLAILEGRP